MATIDNLSAVLYKSWDMRLEQRPIPEPGDHDVLVRVHTVGICGSDVHYWTHGSIGRFVVREPMVLGHETSGTVVQIGGKVSELKLGDRVALEPGIPCRMCELCKVGKYNLCAKMCFHATPPVNGTLARFVVHPADFCYRLPETVSLEEGALLEPLSVAVHSCYRVALKAGQTVLVCGAGPIGLITLLTAKAMGARYVCLTDINEQRLQKATELGADSTLRVETGKTPSEIAQELRTYIGCQPDVAIECCGVESSVQTALLATKSGGAVALVGRGGYSQTIPLVDAATREVDIKGIFRYANSYPKALAMVVSGQVDVKTLISDRFTLEETLDAFKCAKNNSNTIKVVIKCESLPEK